MLSSAYAHELAQIKAKGLYRRRLIIDGAQGPSVRLKDKQVLNFCSNDYLGLAKDPRLIRTFKQAAERYGISSGSSPLVCGRSRALADLEAAVAAHTGRDKALVFSSGYLANLAIMNGLASDKQDLVLQDKLNHASIIDAAILSRARLRRYLHRDIDSLKRRLRLPARQRLVSTEGVFSMEGDIAPLPGVVAACREHGATLIVDDAHGLGVLGEGGGGSLEHFKLNQNDVPVLMATFGKALGGAGAFVAGSAELIDFLLQKARPLIYSTALAPALAASNRAALEIAANEPGRREKLFALIKRFKKGAHELALPLKDSATPIQPLMIGDAETAVRISDKLLEQGVLISAIRPPTVPVNSARLRITFSAGHTAAQVGRLLECLSLVLGKFGIERHAA